MIFISPRNISWRYDCDDDNTAYLEQILASIYTNLIFNANFMFEFSHPLSIFSRAETRRAIATKFQPGNRTEILAQAEIR